MKTITLIPMECGYGPRDFAELATMPRIPDSLSHGIAFTYRSRADAEANARDGGTAFLIGKPIEGLENNFVIYAVTNYHVAWGGFPILRLHLKNDVKYGIELSQSDWVPHPDGYDLAVALVTDRLASWPKLGPAAHLIKCIPTTKFITEEIIRSDDVGFGDDVFMLGRFANHQGTKDKMTPALRLGNISMMPQGIWNSYTNSEQVSFAVEMRSRTGFSGSPVVVHRAGGGIVQSGATPQLPDGMQDWWWLLGVNWGFINERTTGDNTWLNGVIPAWKILEVLEEPVLVDKHASVSEWVKNTFPKGQQSTSTVAVAVSEDDKPAPPASDANPNHREDFTRLLGAAVKTPAPKD